MHAYRCYFLNGKGQFRDVEAFAAENDNEAIAKGHCLIAERDYFTNFEVWQGARLVFGSTADQEASDQRALVIAERTARLLQDLDQIKDRLDSVEQAIRSSQEHGSWPTN
jgi:hypothetical protein